MSSMQQTSEKSSEIRLSHQDATDLCQILLDAIKAFRMFENTDGIRADLQDSWANVKAAIAKSGAS